MYAHAHTRIHPCTHTCPHAHTQTHTHKLMHTWVCAYAHAHTHTGALIHPCEHTCTHAHTHMHMHVRVCTHTQRLALQREKTCGPHGGGASWSLAVSPLCHVPPDPPAIQSSACKSGSARIWFFVLIFSMVVTQLECPRKVSTM